jgi:YegS/Rv2252/BmrU family lipid kinase
MLHASLIYNPAAGRFPSLTFAERAIDMLQKSGWQVRLESARDGAHITHLAHQAAVEGMEAVFIVGGDGSVSLAMAGLLGSDTALGVLPAGTANVWAQELGLPILGWTNWTALEESAGRLALAPTRLADVGLCNGKPFLLWAGVGLDAYVVHRLEPRSRWEKSLATLGYAASAVWEASQYHGDDIHVLADGQEVSGHFLLAAMSNIHLYAGGLAELSPNACLDDGMMDLWLFKGDSFANVVQHALDLFSGRHLQSEQVEYFPFHLVSIQSDATLYVQVDGEPAPEERCVTIEVHPQALRVLVPDNAPHPLFRR